MRNCSSRTTCRLRHLALWSRHCLWHPTICASISALRRYTPVRAVLPRLRCAAARCSGSTPKRITPKKLRDTGNSRSVMKNAPRFRRPAHPLTTLPFFWMLRLRLEPPRLVSRRSTRQRPACPSSRSKNLLSKNLQSGTKHPKKLLRWRKPRHPGPRLPTTPRKLPSKQTHPSLRSPTNPLPQIQQRPVPLKSISPPSGRTPSP